MVKLDVQLFDEGAFENGGDCISSARAFVVAIWAMIISLTGKSSKKVTTYEDRSVCYDALPTIIVY